MKFGMMIAAAALMSFSASAFAADTMPEGVKVKEVTTPGGPVKVLSDAKGMTLYTFDVDKEPGKSACNKGCIEYWPALTASASAKDMGAWTVIARDDGSKQWAHKGKPLYTFVQDKEAADFKGNDMPPDKKLWHCAVPG
jgi:predicted lipoprotein with Yx(FWY)xxD motif